MADHSEDKSLKNKPQGQEKPASPNLIFQDEDEDTPDFDRTINLGTPMVSAPESKNPGSTLPFDSMESLFERESDVTSSTEETNPAPEPEKPADDADELGINTDELQGLQDFMVEDDEEEDEPTVALADMPDEEDGPSDIYSIIGDDAEQLKIKGNSLNDENGKSTAPAKKIELTEADYADANTASADIPNLENVRKSIEPGAESSAEKPQTADETPCDVPEAISEPADAIDSQVISAAATEAHALQDKPEITTEDETPEGLSVKKPAVPPKPAPRTGLAMTFGFIGMAGAAGVLWMNFTLSDRMNQLETQLSSNQENAAASGQRANQRKEIALINQRLDELAATVSSRLAAVSKPVPATARTPPTASTVAAAPSVKPVVTTAKISSGNHKGVWVVNLTSLSNAAAANNELARLKQLGIHAESVKAETRGKTWYRIRVPGFTSAEEADRQRKLLANRLGIRGTWIGKH